MDEKTYGQSDAGACSRFTAARIEELLQAGNDLSEGDEISHADAVDLVFFWRDELDRVRNAYHDRLGKVMLEAMDLANHAAEAMLYPENDKI